MNIIWDVFLNDQLIDSVTYVKSTMTDTPEKIKKSLVEHDGYDPGIIVRKRQPRYTLFRGDCNKVCASIDDKDIITLSWVHNGIRVRRTSATLMEAAGIVKATFPLCDLMYFPSSVLLSSELRG